MGPSHDWPLPARLADYEALMTELGVPGLSAAASADGRLSLLSAGSGTPGGRPIGPETVFQAGSVSKPVTALGALRLVVQGRLKLDADVNDYLRSWRVPPAGDWQPRLTLRHLLTHTAGLTVHGFPGYRHDGPCPTIVEVLDGRAPANTLPARVRWLPGQRFKYSGGGFTVLQLVMSEVTGLAFPELMDQLVLSPAGMRRSTFMQPLPASWHADAALGHNDGGAVPGGWHTYPEMAAAGLWSAPSDLVRFAEMVVGSVRGESGALLPKGLAELLITPQARINSTWQMGLGLLITGEGDQVTFGHDGTDEGYLTLLRFSLSGDAVAVMANAMSARGLVHRIAGDATVFAKGLGPLAPLSQSVESDFAGDYVAPDGSHVAVARHDHGYALILAGQEPIPLAHYAGSCWISPLDIGVDLRIQGGTDETAVLRPHQLGETLVYVRGGGTEKQGAA